MQKTESGAQSGLRLSESSAAHDSEQSARGPGPEPKDNGGSH